MTFETWNDLFVGMIVSMLLLNVVQWSIYRERIYGLYTLYMLVWLIFFGARMPVVSALLSGPITLFIKACVPSIGYFIYFDFADAFIQVRRRLPRLLRLFQLAKTLIILYLAVQAWALFISTVWQPGRFNGVHTGMRVLLAVLAIVGIANLFRLRTTATRYFVTGSLFLVVGALASMVLTFVYPTTPDDAPCWHAPLFWFQLGILGELLCFGLGLNYRQRQAAVTSALIAQELEQERQNRHREQLESRLAVQQLQQEMLEVQMRALQAHLNPHFLFNSLNSLSSLIAEAPAQAEAFVDELASVYRYILQTNAQELTALDNELQFMDSYYHLLQTRYTQGIQLQMHIDDRYRNHLIPPLTLQLLVENAVKHNAILADAPLVIGIYTTPQAQLVVQNTLQRRQVRVLSNGVGLSNILVKYQMLGQPVPVIEEADGQFVVTLPLIDPPAQ
ncbi:Sensor protein lytS [Fibrella aestuarina BUZ 2]|uniref:Sensor protein lytS n=1 Tax=Fibrella aestuarina BUZ 2 TaxID=1166018 RepID=I0KEV1_9BACT|nr:histidine kinase [Fibrella aestuarina]CCH02654.1 Sensor protein lytS [Fibrella aestuarina BUZ 2]